jgi:hypothetical protein
MKNDDIREEEVPAGGKSQQRGGIRSGFEKEGLLSFIRRALREFFKPTANKEP